MQSHDGLGINLKKVLVGLAGLFGVLFLVMTALHFFEGSQILALPGPASSPRLQVEFESGVLASELKIRDTAELQSYRWVDSSQSRAVVPLARAQEIYLENLKKTQRPPR